MGAVIGHSDVRNELISWISEPHGLDIASDDIGSFVTFGKIEMLDCRAHGVGEGFDENVKKIGVLHL